MESPAKVLSMKGDDAVCCLTESQVNQTSVLGSVQNRSRRENFHKGHEGTVDSVLSYDPSLAMEYMLAKDARLNISGFLPLCEGWCEWNLQSNRILRSSWHFA